MSFFDNASVNRNILCPLHLYKQDLSRCACWQIKGRQLLSIHLVHALLPSDQQKRFAMFQMVVLQRPNPTWRVKKSNACSCTKQ